jgi:hypothetical protein
VHDEGEVASKILLRRGGDDGHVHPHRSPTRTVEGETPFEAWHGKAPIVHFFRTFGCIVHVKNTCLGLKKLDDWSRKTIFIGYEGGSKVYRCYDPVKQRVIVSRDVIFDEVGMWHWLADGEEIVSDAEPFTVEYVTETIQAPVHCSASPLQPAAPVGTGGAPGSPAEPAALASANDTEQEEIDLDANHDDSPL